MKFIYIDESGNPDPDQGDVFTMAGIMIDGADLGEWTSKLKRKISRMLARHEGQRMSNLKAKAFIEGKREWSKYVPQNSRMKFFRDLCTTVTQRGRIYAYGMSFKQLRKAIYKASGSLNSRSLPNRYSDYWIATSMFITCLVQKKMQRKLSSAELILLRFDRHNLIPTLSDQIYERSAWYDSLYARPYKVGHKTYLGVKREDRFDRISGIFPIESEHSTLIQTADVLSYIYRRHLELESGGSPNYPDEPTNYKELVGILEPKREQFGRYPKAHPQGMMTAVKFYELAKHPHWAL